MLDEADELQPTARPLGDLSAQPEIQGHLRSAFESCTPPGRSMGGWSMQRQHQRSAPSALHAMAEEGPVTSRIRSEESQGKTASPLYLKAEHGRLDPPGDNGTRGGTAHRSVRWGRPSGQKIDSKADSSPWASAESAHGDRCEATNQISFALDGPWHTPPRAPPEGGGGGGLRRVACEAREVPVGSGQGTPRHRRCRLLEWTCMQHWSGELSSHLPPRLGAESRSQ
jgi:hypothetical protein